MKSQKQDSSKNVFGSYRDVNGYNFAVDSKTTSVGPRGLTI